MIMSSLCPNSRRGCPGGLPSTISPRWPAAPSRAPPSAPRPRLLLVSVSVPNPKRSAERNSACPLPAPHSPHPARPLREFRGWLPAAPPGGGADAEAQPRGSRWSGCRAAVPPPRRASPAPPPSRPPAAQLGRAPQLPPGPPRLHPSGRAQVPAEPGAGGPASASLRRLWWAPEPRVPCHDKEASPLGTRAFYLFFLPLVCLLPGWGLCVERARCTLASRWHWGGLGCLRPLRAPDASRLETRGGPAEGARALLQQNRGAPGRVEGLAGRMAKEPAEVSRAGAFLRRGRARPEERCPGVWGARLQVSSDGVPAWPAATERLPALASPKGARLRSGIEVSRAQLCPQAGCPGWAWRGSTLSPACLNSRVAVCEQGQRIRRTGKKEECVASMPSVSGDGGGGAMHLRTGHPASFRSSGGLEEGKRLLFCYRKVVTLPAPPPPG